MLDVRDIAIPEGAEEFTVQAMELYDGDTLLCDLGFKPYDMIAQRVYIWLRPTAAFKARHARQILPLLKEFEGLTIFANIETADRNSCRFAEFFGFTRSTSNDTHTAYERSF